MLSAVCTSTAASRKCRGSQLENSAIAGATRAVLESCARAKMLVRLHEELLVLCQGYDVGGGQAERRDQPSGLS